MTNTGTMKTFCRFDGTSVTIPNADTADQFFDSLITMTPDEWIKHGMCKWSECKDTDRELWLYPVEWYNFIPKGSELIDIHGNEFQFESGVTDYWAIHGMLCYGIMIPK